LTTNRELAERAQAVVPGGVASPARSFEPVGGAPISVERAKGAELVDVEDDTYVDLISAYGAILLGHGHPRVTQVCQAAAREGLNTATPYPDGVRLAERIVDARPSADWTRLVNSGTEAVMSALRLARGATGRDTILAFEGCYHGHWDPLLVEAGSGVDVFGDGNSDGVPEAVTRDTAVLPLDDEAALDAYFDEHGDETAAAVIEPVPANHGLLPQREAFLQCLEDRCREHGTLLVLDEIVTGFRLGPAGAAGRLDLDPDLVTLGKVIGGGLPIGAFAGRDPIGEHVSPLGDVYQAGTASGNRIACAAGNAVLDHLDEHPGALDDLEARTREMADRATQALEPVGARVRVEGPLAWLTFHPEPLPRRAGTLDDAHREAFGRLHRAAREHGLLLPPSPVECLFPTLAHDEATVDRVVGALAAAAEDLEEAPA
jgi:glutamate-1-semialdehyde 2,1-aminomutase